MHANVNLSAPIGALAFLGSSVLLGAAALFLIYSLTARSFSRARLTAAFMLVFACMYLGTTLIFAFASSEVALARGEEKHFCELDCHLAYSVADLRQTQVIGSGANTVVAGGTLTLVTIKTRFDETTIGPTRGNGLLYPNSHQLTIVDGEGRTYWPSQQAQAALESAGDAGTPLQSALRPGESYLTTVVFDLPGDATNPSLLINEGEWVTHFIIGHENSFLHKKVRFQL